MIAWFGGRKALATLTVLLIGTGITLYRGDIPDNLLVLLGWVFSAFVVGNVAADFKKGTLTSSVQSAPAPELENKINNLVEAVAVQGETLGVLTNVAVQSQQQAQQMIAQQAQRNRQAVNAPTGNVPPGFNPA